MKKWIVFCNMTHDGGALYYFDTQEEAQAFYSKDSDAEVIIYGEVYAPKN